MTTDPCLLPSSPHQLACRQQPHFQGILLLLREPLPNAEAPSAGLIWQTKFTTIRTHNKLPRTYTPTSALVLFTYAQADLTLPYHPKTLRYGIPSHTNTVGPFVWFAARQVSTRRCQAARVCLSVLCPILRDLTSCCHLRECKMADHSFPQNSYDPPAAMVETGAGSPGAREKQLEAQVKSADMVRVQTAYNCATRG